MNNSFVAETQVTIHAPVAAVWKTLTDPELVKEYLYGTEMQTDWQVGSPITWSGEWKGQPYEDKGEVLALTPGKLLKTTHWSPLGGSEDTPENYHTVTYELFEQVGGTLLKLSQDNNPTQEAADKMAADSWGPVLEGLKTVAEKQGSSV